MKWGSGKSLVIAGLFFLAGFGGPGKNRYWLMMPDIEVAVICGNRQSNMPNEPNIRQIIIKFQGKFFWLL
jgi:hypothetical protein